MRLLAGVTRVVVVVITDVGVGQIVDDLLERRLVRLELVLAQLVVEKQIIFHLKIFENENVGRGGGGHGQGDRIIDCLSLTSNMNEAKVRCECFFDWFLAHAY